ncbi:MAG: hydroxyphenylacetyl-CoA thioesterase PaaI [Shimia sp.]
MDDDERARRSAEALWATDVASRSQGMEIVDVSAGRAVLRMTIRPDHLNGHGTCHGGILFMLADSAFAYACNGRNQAAVAQHASVTFLAPGRGGDVVLATAREVSVAGRSGLYDVEVAVDGGAVIAQFRGHSRQVPGRHFDEAATGR